MKLILASTSPFRKSLLDRLQLDYTCATPNVDETPLADESIEQLVIRLAQLKAEAVANQYPDALIIGSDQSAELNGQALTKPGNFDNAVEQLKQASGKRVVFYTGLCLLNTQSGHKTVVCEPYTVVFKKLSDRMIKNYLEKEKPYNCAGSFKSEGLGVALFEKFEGDDPNSLIGLPLIKLTELLEKEGLAVLD